MYNEHRTVAHTGVRWQGRLQLVNTASVAILNKQIVLFSGSISVRILREFNPNIQCINALSYLHSRHQASESNTSNFVVQCTSYLPVYLWAHKLVAKCKSITVRESRGTSSTKLEVRALNQFVIWGPVHTQRTLTPQ